MKLKEIDEALGKVRHFHEVISGYRILDGCWGWGAVRVDGRDRGRCADCGKPAGMVFEDGTVRCHRCAMWRHFGSCPYLKEVENGKGDLRDGTGHSQVSAPAM